MSWVSVGKSQSLPDLINFAFTVVETKNLPGKSESPGAPCNGVIAAADQIQDFAIAVLPHTEMCSTGGWNNHNNYKVDRGTVEIVGGGTSLPAYKIYEPATKTTNFVAYKHAVYYRFPTVENYTVYSLVEGSSLAKVADVPASAIPNTTDFIRVTNTAGPITVSGLVGSITYVFVPASTRASSFTFLAPGVEGARVAATPLGDVLKYRYSVPGTPADTVSSYTAGPGHWNNTYSDLRRFFLVRNGNALGAVWENQVDSSIKLTWFGPDLRSPNTVTLPSTAGQRLACATGDDAGNVYYLTIQTGSGVPSTPRTASLAKAGPAGNLIVSSPLDTSGAGLNVVAFFEGLQSVASLKFVNGKLGLMMGRKMVRSDDGLNHQGGVAVVFDATSLAIQRDWGQTSGHSWENVLTSNSVGEFVGIDLGDNFPRGVHLHKFSGTKIDSRVVNTFKTRHGTTAQNPAGTTYPAYPEISGAGTSYYKWSNDNSTYTELGGVEQTSLGYAVCFAGERSPAGRLLDNSRVGTALNDPRNIGFVTVREDFQRATGGRNEVSDDLVLTAGQVETAQFYEFTGGLISQRNAGVVWLTQYASLAQNASRVKMTSRADGGLLLLWEVWTDKDYVATKAMTVTPNGSVVNGETDLTAHVRLSRRDDLVRVGNNIYFLAGRKDNTLELMVIEPGGQATAPNITAHPQPRTVNVGTTVTFTTASIGSSPLTYQWRLNGQNLADSVGISGSSTATLTLQNVQATQAGNYDVVVSNNLGRQTSNPALLTVVVVPVVVLHPQNQSVSVGETATFTALANGLFPGTAPSQISGEAALAPGQFLLSPNHRYQLLYQTDGNLVLYRADGVPLWASGTSGQPLGRAVMQVDGNLVVYGPTGTPQFATGTSGNPNAQLVMQDDGNLVIYAANGAPIFASGTFTNGPDRFPIVRWQLSTDNGVTFADIPGAAGVTLTLANVTLALQGNRYRAIFTDANGSVATKPAMLSVNGFGFALNTANLVWTVSGDSPWFPQTTNTHDGVSAVQSGRIGHNESSKLETTVTGPATVAFWWRSDTERNFDTLSLELDGTMLFRISGPVAWEQKTIDVTAGTHTLRWVYAKDKDGGAGADACWVDEVEVRPLRVPTTLAGAVDAPQAATLATGGAAGWTPQAWDGGVPEGGLIALAGLQTLDAASSSSSSFYSRDGEDSARSGQIGDNEETYMEINVTGPVTVRFWWRVDSEEDYDFLDFEIDDEIIDGISGLVDWEEILFDVPAGEHVLRWVYRKDEALSEGADAGWVDLIEFFESDPPLTLAEVLETDGLRWSTSGDQPWFTALDPSDDTIVVARSGVLYDSEESRLETTVVGPADLSFWWRVDSEQGFDTLSFELDGNTVSAISGDLDWEEMTVVIPTGQHQVRWVYRKDSNGSAGLDAGFVDAVSVTRPTPGEGGEVGPRLQLRTEGRKLRLSWPGVGLGFQLQSTDTLNNPNWRQVPPSQIRQGDGEFVHLIELPTAGRFYRLMKP